MLTQPHLPRFFLKTFLICFKFTHRFFPVFSVSLTSKSLKLDPLSLNPPLDAERQLEVNTRAVVFLRAGAAQPAALAGAAAPVLDSSVTCRGDSGGVGPPSQTQMTSAPHAPRPPAHP